MKGVADRFWEFFFYSFAGYLLEKGFARRTHASQQIRKGLLLLPLCPVYGLGMTAVLALPAALRESPWLLPAGAAAATAVEYGFHWACDTLLGVRFWDYSAVRGNLRGRVCLPFSLAWGPLIAAALLLFQPPLGALIARIPPGVTLAAVLLLTLDALCSVRLLRLTHDPAALRLGALPDGMRLVFSPSAPRI